MLLDDLKTVEADRDRWMARVTQLEQRLRAMEADLDRLLVLAEDILDGLKDLRAGNP